MWPDGITPVHTLRGHERTVAALAGGALWLHLPNGSARSKWTPALMDRLAGSTTTTRNWNTLLKLIELL